jgi:DNA-binding XRE family transcriptional regulator
MHISREACRAARVGLGWTRGELAKAAGLGERTIIDFERGARDPHDNNKAAIRAALEGGGVTFSSENCICLPATEAASE